MITGDNHEYLSAEAAFKSRRRKPESDSLEEACLLISRGFVDEAASLVWQPNFSTAETKKSFRIKLHIFIHLHAHRKTSVSLKP